METFIRCILALFIVVVGSAAEYVGGRILLPELGLSAPEYWTWFWAMFWMTIICTPIWIIKEVVK